MTNRYPLSRLQKFLESARVIEQETGGLSVRACMNAWGYKSTAATQYAMNAMVDEGLLRRFPRQKYSIYRTAEGV